MKSVIPFAFPGLPHISCAFTTRHAGNMSMHTKVLERCGSRPGDVARRRMRVLRALGIAAWTELNQAHGDRFLVNPEATPPELFGGSEADGQCTNMPGHALCIKTADCQPILLAHPAGYVAALHVGWRGNLLKFPVSGVRCFCDAYGLNAEDIVAVRGPSLGHAEFVNFADEWPEEFSSWLDAATKRMDLWGLTRSQLEQAGLLPRNIYSLDLCTWSLADILYSHRRGHPERQAALIWIHGDFRGKDL